MALDSIVNTTVKGIKWYGEAIRKNYKQFIPALVVSTVAAGGAQELADALIENPNEWITQLSGYLGATAGGYGTFLSLEFRNNREKYPNGFLSKEMGKTFVDIASSDYLADVISYTPVFIASNHYLLNQEVGEGIAGSISAGIASTTYFFTMCGLYDVFQRFTHRFNTLTKRALNKLKNKS